jgi:hypothetical protein
VGCRHLIAVSFLLSDGLLFSYMNFPILLGEKTKDGKNARETGQSLSSPAKQQTKTAQSNNIIMKHSIGHFPTCPAVFRVQEAEKNVSSQNRNAWSGLHRKMGMIHKEPGIRNPRSTIE